jgi:hypothetical protein
MPTNKKGKARQAAWFKPVRGSYLPVRAAGWLTYIPFVSYLAFSFTVGILKTSSVLIAILFIIPNWVAAGAVLTYIAAKKSGQLRP